jgi:hypothetical protein
VLSLRDLNKLLTVSKGFLLFACKGHYLRIYVQKLQGFKLMVVKVFRFYKKPKFLSK